MDLKGLIKKICEKQNIYYGNIKINIAEGKFKNLRIEKTPTVEEIKELEKI